MDIIGGMNKSELSPLVMGEFFAESSVQEDGTIRNCLLCGLSSANGYSIEATAFGQLGEEDKVKRLYANAPVFLNHSFDGEGNPQTGNRDLSRLVGTVFNPRRDSLGRPRGDIKPVPGPAGETLVWLAKEQPNGVSLSHVAAYERNAEGTAVTDVRRVDSVDVVYHAATTETFRENRESPMAAEQDAYKELAAESRKAQEKAEASVKALQAECNQLKEEREEQRVVLETLKAESEEGKKAIEELAALKHKTVVDKELSDAGIDIESAPSFFLNPLHAESSAAKRAELIKEYLAHTPEPNESESTGTQPRQTPVPDEPEEFSIESSLEGLFN